MTFGQLQNITFYVKTDWATFGQLLEYFGQLLEYFGQLYTLTSGHTVWPNTVRCYANILRKSRDSEVAIFKK